MHMTNRTMPAGHEQPDGGSEELPSGTRSSPPSGNEKIQMRRQSLTGIPDYPVAGGYRLRRYRRGDEVAWIAIHRVADPYHDATFTLFARAFGPDPALLAQRQYYLIDPGGTPVGTATAWFPPDNCAGALGRVHWVAIHPEHQGRGLAKPLMSRVCRRLRELGHTQAYLTTSSARLPAINLYRHFGFEPDVRNDREAAVWADLLAVLAAPDRSRNQRQ